MNDAFDFRLKTKKGTSILLLYMYTEQQKKRPAYIFLSYLKLKYQNIYFLLNMNTTMCKHRIVVII